MVEILITIIIYIIGVMVALKMIENMCKGKELDYPMVFFVGASSWVVVSFLLIKIAVDKITDIWIKKITFEDIKKTYNKVLAEYGIVRKGSCLMSDAKRAKLRKKRKKKK